MAKRLARRYSDGSFNVSTESDDTERARRLLGESSDDDDTELVEVDITITRSFGRPKLELVRQVETAALIEALLAIADGESDADEIARQTLEAAGVPLITR